MDIKRVNEEEFLIYSSSIEGLFNDSVNINFPSFNVDKDYGARKCKEVVDYLKDGSAVVYVAIEDDNLMGWIWCHEINRIGCKRLHIAEIAVHDRYRKMGVATLLLDRVEEYAKLNNYLEIDLFVSASNLAAVQLYKSSSYDVERYQMCKRLSPKR